MKTINFNKPFIFAMFIVCAFFIFLLICAMNISLKEDEILNKLHLTRANNLINKEVSLHKQPDKTDLNCKMYNCFDIYKCGKVKGKPYQISVYIYPLYQFVDSTNKEYLSPDLSQEFFELYSTIAKSKFYTDDPQQACIFVPPIDLLNQNNLKTVLIGKLLSHFSYWNHGKNNLIFNMLPGTYPDYSTSLQVARGKALLAGSSFSYWSYRNNFDISIPMYSSLAYSTPNLYMVPAIQRKYFLVSSQVNLHFEFKAQLEKLASKHNDDFLFVQKCRTVNEDESAQKKRCYGIEEMIYPEMLYDATFCLVLPTSRLGQTMLSDVMKTGCIPVFVCDTYVLPFSEVLDWTRASVSIREENLERVMDILREIPQVEIKLKQRQVQFYYKKYFSTMSSIVLTTLEILNQRIFPQRAKDYHEWNSDKSWGLVSSTFALTPPHISKESEGFTAVILAYNRIESMFELMTKIDKAPNLVLILIVWNNQHMSFPPLSDCPHMDTEWKVIAAPSNKLSNRFFPYEEIKTEAVMSIDDDIVMLTIDEIEFGYQVWKEFPDRIVGFPPRLHMYSDERNLKYESEWKNNISIVLTGASFYHNYFNYLYTYKMPDDIKSWVDNHMNCEDIAMNFIVSNYTGKAPIKVTPRKKFKCSNCNEGTGLSLDAGHMVERSQCMNYFVKAYGMLPLKSVSFRADPLLYLDDFPTKLKLFQDIGSL